MDFWEIFKNTFFYRTPPVAAPDSHDNASIKKYIRSKHITHWTHDLDWMSYIQFRLYARGKLEHAQSDKFTQS